MDNAEVLIKFKADDKDVEDKAKGLGSKLSSAAKVGGASLAAIGTAAAATASALTSSAKATAQYGDAIDKNSQKVGFLQKHIKSGIMQCKYLVLQWKTVQ